MQNLPYPSEDTQIVILQHGPDFDMNNLEFKAELQVGWYLKILTMQNEQMGGYVLESMSSWSTVVDKRPWRGCVSTSVLWKYIWVWIK